MKEIFDYIKNQEKLVIEIQQKLTEIPAINPENGGDGEYNKFLFLKNYISSWNFDKIEELFAPDDRVSSKKRPSLLAEIKGENAIKSLWIITHLDVVPAGELELWDTDPFKAIVKDGKIYGRGTEDNQQSLVSSLIAAKSLIDNNIKPKNNVKLLFVADEEVGSNYGIKWLLKNKQEYFLKDDLFIIPDGGHNESKTIEIAEKSILWINFKITGKQSHGSRPDLGINASKASSHFCVRMEKLYEIFNEENKMFDIPYSTFEPTKRYNSITNMNTIPGEEYIGYDCRILPEYDLEEVKIEMKKIARSVEVDFGVKFEIEILQNVQAPKPTPADSEIVELLKKSIKKILDIDAITIGIGGGTVAADFRMLGYNAAIWSTIDTTMHAPNEYSKIQNTINDAKVFSDMMINSN
jgi:succinyl-diaminopimelate desuccinylase